MPDEEEDGIVETGGGGGGTDEITPPFATDMGVLTGNELLDVTFEDVKDMLLVDVTDEQSDSEMDAVSNCKPVEVRSPFGFGGRVGPFDALT